MEIESDTLKYALQDRFRSWGVKYLLADLDGTLVPMFDYMDGYTTAYASKISTLSAQPVEEISAFMNKARASMRKEFSVHPANMHEAARVTALRYGLDYYSPEIQAAKEDLVSLYSNAPVAFEGVYESLGILKNTGLGLAISTHGDRDWTDIKLARNGLYNYFGKDKIFTFPSWGKKGINEWKSVMDALGVLPSEVIVAGDNWKSDVNPVVELGVPRARIFRIQTAFEDANTGVVDGVREIRTFSELPYKLLE